MFESLVRRLIRKTCETLVSGVGGEVFLTGHGKKFGFLKKDILCFRNMLLNNYIVILEQKCSFED